MYINFREAGAVDYSSHLHPHVLVPVAISSSDTCYTSVAVARMKAMHIQIIEHDFKYLGIDLKEYKFE